MSYKVRKVIKFVKFGLAFCFINFTAFNFCAAQIPKDSAGSGVLIALSYAGQLPGGNMAQEFGFNSNVQGGVYYKTSHNLIFGLNGGFIFGNVLKEQGILDSIATSDGNIIANDGNYTQVTYFERGFYFQLTCGKLFPLNRKNLNSGILTTFSAGYLQHHIDIEANNDWAPQITGDYLQGYDRLTAGVCITEFIGYQYISKHLLITCFGGFEFTQAFTKSLRYDFDLKSQNTNLRYDLLSGIRVGWVLPILKEPVNTFYTY